MTDERNLLTREELNLIDDFLVTSEPRVWCILRRRTAAGAVTNGRRAV